MDPLDRRSRQAQRLRHHIIANSTLCHLCNQPVDKTRPHRDPRTGRIDPLSASVDAIVPRSQGGSHLDPSNLRLAHLGCNCARHDDPLQPATNQRTDAW